jgi:serine/threonine protein kinase
MVPGCYRRRDAVDTRADDTIDATVGQGPGTPLHEGACVGRYEVVEKIGAGGMGEVYRARDPQLHREVALKLVKPQFMRGRGGAEHRARLLREARAMAQLTHPNVVRVYDVGEHEDGVFLAMELVEGTDAAKWYRAERPKWQRVLGVFRAAGRGLAAAHAAGLVHRDFKPANVLVGDDQRVRVMDFGLARAVEDVRGDDAPTQPDPSWSEIVTSHGVVVGTPAYMAPEQFVGLPADARSDQYAYCVSLWEALFLRLPFGGANARAIGAAKANDELRMPPPDSDVPRALVDVLARGMASDRERRFDAMRDVLRALREIAEPSEPAPQPAAPRRWPWPTLAITALGGLAVWMFLRGDPCDADADTDALRERYAASRDPVAARRIAATLADHWRARGCDALTREWNALATP